MLPPPFQGKGFSTHAGPPGLIISKFKEIGWSHGLGIGMQNIRSRYSISTILAKCGRGNYDDNCSRSISI